MCLHILGNCVYGWPKFRRIKFVGWTKKFDKMENLQMEFEVKGVADAKVRSFQPEMDAKYAHMVAFKKQWGKFALSLDTHLKKKEYLSDI